MSNIEDQGQGIRFVGPVAEISIVLGDAIDPNGQQHPVIIITGKRTQTVQGIPEVEELGALNAEHFALKALFMIAAIRAANEPKPSNLLVAKPGTRVN